MKRSPVGIQRRRQRGLTLFELLLALAIFLTALAALSQLIASGTRAAAQSRLQTEAIFRCESKLGELVAGAIPIESSSKASFDDDKSWSWTLDVEDTDLSGLQFVEVRVSHTGKSALGNTSFSLRHYVRDPRLLRQEERHVIIPSAHTRATPLPTSESAQSDPEDLDK